MPAVLDRVLKPDTLLPSLERQDDVVLGAEALRARVELVGGDRREILRAVRQVVPADDHVLGRRGECLPVRRRQDVVRGEHENPRLRLGLRRERKMHGHLVAVEVCVERVADERVDLDRLALDEHGLERLDAEPV
jgi:hypothetical protein